ncbi:MAG: SLC13 family permease [Planctomycetaceae bacterium]
MAGTPPETGRGRLIVAVILLLSLWTASMQPPTGMQPEALRLIAVTILMAGLWVTQAVPLAATSLLPLALFPVLGIQTAEVVSKSYINDNVFLYLGGFIIALGIERWNLHRRIALNIVRVVGTGPKRLVLGFLIATGGLSMWISNTASTLLMLPIALALLKTLDDEQSVGQPSGHVAGQPLPELLSKKLAVPLLLAIAYSASLGGMTTIIGTPTNTTAVSIYRTEFRTTAAVVITQPEGVDNAAIDLRPTAPDISVAQWMLASIPVGAVYLAFTWWVLTFRLPSATDHDDALRVEMKKRLIGLGRPGVAERRMFGVFVLTALLWIFRKPLILGTATVLPGWSGHSRAWFAWLGTSMSTERLTATAGSFINDSTIAMLMAFLLFCIPSGTRDDRGRCQKLMDWETATHLPWDIVLLIGGGFALAGAFGSTHLSEWLGLALQEPLSHLPIWLVIAVVCLLMTFLTEFTSNVATISTLLPTLCAVCVALKMDPRLLVVPATLATSCAFMLPIATPPNAIVFGAGRIQVSEMMRYGIVLNLVGVLILTAGTYLFIKPLMGIP